MLVTVITPSNAAIFPEYIIPNIRHLVSDPEVSVRCTYAQCITQLADTAVRYLEMGQALKAHGSFKISAEVQDLDHAHYEVSGACSFTIITHFIFLSGVVRSEHAGSANEYPRALVIASYGPIERCQTRGLARYFVPLHLPRKVENE